MCYRCDLCDATVPPGRARQVYVVQRKILALRVLKTFSHDNTGARRLHSRSQTYQRLEIEREIPVCGECYKLLANGATLDEVQKHLCSKQAKPTLQIVSAPARRRLAIPIPCGDSA